MTERLSTRSLAIGHAGTVLARGIDLRLASGEIMAITGPSGCGKSTLLATIAGIAPALAGDVLLDGQVVTSRPVHQRGIGMVFQDPLLFPHLSVLDNIAYGLRRMGVRRQEAREQSAELLEWIGMAEFGARRVDQLSGGQAQRVALARTMAPQPSVVLLDEPFSALDFDLRHRLAAEVAELLRARGVATVHVTHDLAEARAMSDRAVAFAEISEPPA